MPPTPFNTRKSQILTSLSRPPSTYTDASPKGSLDTRISNLLDALNALDGTVSTSSCAGRVCVFVEGGRDARVDSEVRDGDGETRKPRRKKGGEGGRWIFTSHDPVAVPSATSPDACAALLGLNPLDAPDHARTNPRAVHFKFEPMILHALTSSIPRADALLKAAQQAGFRESGASSLDSGMPVVAVRCAGLGLDCIVGFAGGVGGRDERGDRVDGGAVPPGEGESREEIRATVPDAHLRVLLEEANRRFEVNGERMRRFRELLLGLSESSGVQRNGRGGEWEDGKKRRERKREEGLERQRVLASRGGGEGGKVGEGDEEFWAAESDG